MLKVPFKETTCTLYYYNFLIISVSLRAITILSSPNENRELLSLPWQQAPPLLPHSVANTTLYKNEDTAMHCLSTPTGRPAHPDESKYVTIFEKVDLSSNFYFRSVFIIIIIYYYILSCWYI